MNYEELELALGTSNLILIDNELRENDLYKMLKEYILNNFQIKSDRYALSIKQINDETIQELFNILINSIVETRFKNSMFHENVFNRVIVVDKIKPKYEYDSYTDEYYLTNIRLFTLFNEMMHLYSDDSIDFTYLDIYEIRKLYNIAKSSNSEYICVFMEKDNLHDDVNIIINKKLILNLYIQYIGNVNTIY